MKPFLKLRLPNLSLGYQRVLEQFYGERQAELESLCSLLGSATQSCQYAVADSCPLIQIVGLPGTGKTCFLKCFLTYSNILFAYVNCSFANISRREWGTHSGVLVDSILNPLMYELLTCMRRTLAASGVHRNVYSQLDYKKITSLQTFPSSFMRLLEEWTRLCVSLFCETCELPTPVLVFDHSEILHRCTPSLLKLLSQLPQYVASLTNATSLFCRSLDIIVIFSSSTIVYDVAICPVIFFNMYSKNTRTTLLQNMFDTLGFPMCNYLAGAKNSFSQNDMESNQLKHSSDCKQVYAFHHMNASESFLNLAEFSDEETLFSVSSEGLSEDMRCGTSESSSESSSETGDSVNHINLMEEDCLMLMSGEGQEEELLQSLNESPVAYSTKTENEESPQVSSMTVVCANPRMASNNAPDGYWVELDYLDNVSNKSLSCIGVGYNVFKAFWIEFLTILTPHLAILVQSDFSETLFLVRRLWGLYLKPLLYCEPILANLLQQGDLDGIYQELRSKFEKTSYCVKLSQHVFLRHVKTYHFCFAGYDTCFLSEQEEQQAHLLCVSLNRYEGSILSLVLLLAAFVASQTRSCYDHDLLIKIHETSRGNSKLKKVFSSPITESSSSFSFLRWIWITQVLFLLLGHPLVPSLHLFQQISLLLQIQLVVSLDGDTSPLQTAFGLKSNLLVCATPAKTIIDLAQRVDLPIDSLLPFLY